jgi:ditrans,polycis-polyprenyl diphosphate synthase
MFPDSHRQDSLEGREQYPDLEGITAESIEKHLGTADSPPLDLLVRTSAVRRLSDFMLWQCHEKTDIVFTKSLWPDFGFYELFLILLSWQSQHP